MEKIENILEISKSNSQNKHQKQHDDSNISLISKAIRDAFIYCVIFIISNLILYSDLENRSFREKFVIIFLFLLTLCYTIITNLKHKILSFFYAAVIFILIIAVIDTRKLSQLHLIIFLCIMTTSLIFHFVKKTVNEKNSKAKFPIELDSGNFFLIGTLNKNIDITLEKFIEKRELNIERKTYNNYKPILTNKTTNSKNEIVLKYSNNEELSFTILITKDNDVYISHWKENNSIDLTNISIIEELENIC
ncbi:hypothetical protein ACQY1Q_12795 [Tenacibaculum sp. TC6]|uniref:hypothetical protein n=1 Tax=Tenacibaculum sp. TC6 TaxID=3423223 RepID=UPI003D36C053